jgi:hypothetical protein
MKHGFIFSTDLTDDKAYPVISNLIEEVLSKNETINTGELSREALETTMLQEFNDDLSGKNSALTPLEKLNNSSVKVKAEVFKHVYHLLCLNY